MAENIDTNVVETEQVETNETVDAESVAQLRAELAKQKAALDKATKEAGDYRKALRQKQSAEEAAAEEKRIADEEMEKELSELRKKFAVADLSKKLMGFIQDEASATNMAEYLYGADNADAVVGALNKAWTAREKALRLEYGKIPAPGVGASEGPTITKDELDKMTYKERLEFATNHPDEYEILMGRHT